MFPQATLELEGIGTVEIAITGFEDAMRADPKIRESIRALYAIIVAHALQALKKMAELTDGAELVNDVPPIQFYIPITHGDTDGRITVTWQPHCKLDEPAARDALMQYFESDYVGLALHRPIPVDVMTEPGQGASLPNLPVAPSELYAWGWYGIRTRPWGRWQVDEAWAIMGKR